MASWNTAHVDARCVIGECRLQRGVGLLCAAQLGRSRLGRAQQLLRVAQRAAKERVGGRGAPVAADGSQWQVRVACDFSAVLRQR